MCQRDHSCAEVERLKSQIAALEQLLEAHARTVLEQSARFSDEQEQLRLEKILMECQRDRPGPLPRPPDRRLCAPI
jgi:hypothetical protein